MNANLARALGIGAAALLWTVFGSVDAQTVPSNASQPLNAAANALTGGQVGAPVQTPYGATATPTVPSTTSQPLNAAANALTGGQVGAPVQAPYGATATTPSYNYASGYAGVASQPTYAPSQPTYAPSRPVYATSQQVYPTTYYQSGYGGYAQPAASPCGHRRGWNPVNRFMNATRPVAQPRGMAYPSYQGYSAPGYAPMYGYTYTTPR